jgi:hypothetical protein
MLCCPHSPLAKGHDDDDDFIKELACFELMD